MFTLNCASFPIPYFNLLFSFIGNGLALSFNIFGMFLSSLGGPTLKKSLTLYFILNYYDHMIHKHSFRILPFPAMISSLV